MGIATIAGVAMIPTMVSPDVVCSVVHACMKNLVSSAEGSRVMMYFVSW